MSRQLGSIRWGDVDYEDEDHSIDQPTNQSTNRSSNHSIQQGTAMPVVPAMIVCKPDASGVRTVIEYGTNELGQKIKITKKVKAVTKLTQIPRRVIERKSWKKFGDCAGLPPGPEANVTYTSIEVIHLDLRPKKRTDEKEESSLDKLSLSSSIVVCRHCGSTGHWTLKCPKRNTITPAGEGAQPAASSSLDEGVSGSAAQSGKYVPMQLRGGRVGGQNDDNTLRVTNISEETTESDLGNLFRRFGHTSRIFLAKDYQTGLSRGFAFISYSHRQEAEAAIKKLNGYGYDNLILHVEWAKPREQSDDSRRDR